MATLSEERKLDDKLVDCIKRTVKIVNRSELLSSTNYDQDIVVHAFDRTLQRLIKQELGI